MKKSRDLKAEDKIPFIYKWFPTLIFICAFLVYANTLNHQYACDDNMYTFENGAVQKGFAGIPELISAGSLKSWNGSNVAYYRPLTLITFAIEKAVFGKSPGAGHLISVFLYAILCVVIYRYLKLLFHSYPAYLSAIAAMLFVFHPLHTEVVANIKSRDEILCMLFGILTLKYAYQYRLSNVKSYLAKSGISFFLCIMSKENGYLYLPLLIVIEYFTSTTNWKYIIKLSLHFVAIAVVGIVMRSLALDSLQLGNNIQVMDNSLMAAHTTGEWYATAFVILLHGMKLLVLPVTLSWDYSFNQFPIVNWSNITAIISLLIHLVLLGFAIYGIRKKSMYSLVIFFYFITSFLTSNLLLKTGATFGERFLFAPSLAFCMILPLLILQLTKSVMLKGYQHPDKKITVFFVLIIVIYSVKTFSRNRDWKNDFTLHASGIVTAPNSAWSHFTFARDNGKIAMNATDEFNRKAAADIAISEYKKSMDIYPGLNHGYYEMAVLYNAIGQVQKAMEMYKQEIQLNPSYSSAIVNYAVTAYAVKNYDLAIEQFNNVLKLRPDEIKIYMGLGASYAGAKRNKEAAEVFERGLKVDPQNVGLMQNLSVVYAEMGDTLRAGQYQRNAAR